MYLYNIILPHKVITGRSILDKLLHFSLAYHIDNVIICRIIVKKQLYEVIYMIDIRIAKWRKIQGYSQRSLAEKMGISQAYISAIETGRETLSVNMLIRFAKTLDVPICELFSEELRVNCPYIHKK